MSLASARAIELHPRALKTPTFYLLHPSSLESDCASSLNSDEGFPHLMSPNHAREALAVGRF